MSPRWRLRGLQAKFLVLVVATLLLMLAMVALLLQRQGAMQDEVVGKSREAMHELVFERLRQHGQAQSAQVADSLVNPLYYFDLDAIGVIARNLLRQPDVRYVLVYDTNGDIIHDGSGDIPTFGQAMRDPLAYEAVSANGVHAQWTDRVLDVSSPVKVGDQRLGGVRIGYSLDAVRADETVASTALGERLGSIGTRHLWWIVVAMLGLVALGALVSYAMQRALVRPIRELADVAREIEAGNFTVSVAPSARNDELGDLTRAFGRMGDSIARHDRDIRRMAYTDALTGLANRLAFRESLDQRLMQLRGQGRSLALLFADIDDFKRVNDTLGHDAGDEVLVQFANRIASAVELYGSEDTLLARFGGDEFVILVQGGSQEGSADDNVRGLAEALAETVVAELARPIMVQGRQVFLGTSVGITLFPDDAAGATALMKNGDIAMYQAKVAGKSCHRFYSRAMDQAVERSVRMEQDLRGAWGRGELSLVYQPIYRLADGSLVGAEALMRWKHPEQGNIAPAVFIDVAEQSGLIESIGPEALRAACTDAMRWHSRFQRGAGLFVSVNVSPRQLRSGELPDQVAAVLRDTGLPAAQLHVELTETAVLGDEMHASALLQRLRSTGVKVWLDDFGTGFSGLSHLRRVPADGVKIDRSFISDVLRDPDDLAQGYWIGHPVKFEEFVALLA